MRFCVWSGAAESISVCLFDRDTGVESARIPMQPQTGGIHSVLVPGLEAGARYGFRADGPHAPDQGAWFDPAKLLVDPYATALDRPFAWDPRLAAARADVIDTASLMPKAIVANLPPLAPPLPPVFKPGGLIYELSVRPFSLLQPDIPENIRGTVAALAHPAVISHLSKLGVNAVELMPVTAWIDERHLAPLGLRNGWGYNPVALMALDPRLCPGGIAELRATTAALRDAGIGVILDVVFNHTGEGDAHGPTLSLRGLDNRAYFRHEPDATLVNDSGCGNTLACDHPATRRLILDAMRHFVGRAGIDGFRFDLAPIMGRNAEGFDPQAALLREITSDPLLGDRILIAEPWDIGPGGYQLGNFPAGFLEWNDRARDSVRRFWRGDAGALGDFATAIAGSSDVFAPPATRSVNFIAAHDGFTLADLVSYQHKHNAANGEDNRDGHNHNHSWNNGVEGATRDPGILASRDRDLRALLATLFASRGTIMLKAGDEFGHSQGGNNNAYAQDNETTWLDWASRDEGLEDFCAGLAILRRARPALSDPKLLDGEPGPDGVADASWLSPDGAEMTQAGWHDPLADALCMLLAQAGAGRLAVIFNRNPEPQEFQLPTARGMIWPDAPDGRVVAGPRSVTIIEESAVALSGPWAPAAARPA